MGDTFVITGLRNNRARLSGEIEQLRRTIEQKQAALGQVDAVIRVFTRDCNPDMISPIQPAGRRDVFFKYRELPRLCLTILRKAKAPMRLDHIVDQVVSAKGFETDSHLRRHITDSVRAKLIGLATKGTVRRIINEPDTWWELVG